MRVFWGVLGSVMLVRKTSQTFSLICMIDINKSERCFEASLWKHDNHQHFHFILLTYVTVHKRKLQNKGQFLQVLATLSLKIWKKERVM